MAVSIPKQVQVQLSYLAVMYERVLGRDITEFHNSVIEFHDNADALDVEERMFMDFVMKFLASKGISYEDVLHNKDLFMSSDVKKEEGSFFTPLRWARKAHELVIDSVGLDELKDYVVWDTACGSGNLLLEFPACKHLYFSTLNGEDVPIVEERLSKRADKQPFTAFQLDFLGSIDSVFMPEFTSQLPEGLQDVLKNNGKLAIVINPPYATRGTNTYVGRELSKRGLTDFRMDLYHQFVWQVINLVNHWNLDNFEFVLMTSGSLHLNKSAEPVVHFMNDNLSYTKGFLYPASDFEGVSGDFVWAISVTHWTRKKGIPHKPVEVLEMEVLETGEKKVPVVDYDGSVIRDDFEILKTCDTVYPVDLPRPFAQWVQDGVSVKKSQDMYRLSVYGDNIVSNSEGKPYMIRAEAEQPIGYVDVRNTLRSAPQYIQVATTPSSSDNVVIREENFDRLVFYFNYALRNKTWEDKAYQRLIAPIEDDFYRDVYMPNAVAHLAGSRKNFAYAVRDFVSPSGIYSFASPMFWIEDEEVLDAIMSNDNDVYREKLLADFNAYKGRNTYVQQRVSEALASPNLSPIILDFMNYLKLITLKYLAIRKVRDDHPLDSAFDLNYAQIRRLPNFETKDEEIFHELHNKAWAEIEKLNRRLSFNFGDKNVNN